MPIRRATYICFSRDNGPQCGYVGYPEFFDAMKSRTPIHWHGSTPNREPRWGPASQCTAEQEPRT